MASPREQVLEAIPRAAGAPRGAPVTAGAVDAAGRVAWIETRDDIAHLLVAAGGRVLLELSLAVGATDDYGYEGCSAGFIEWFGDRAVTISSETRRTVVWSIALPAVGAAPSRGALASDAVASDRPGVRRLVLDRTCAVDGDLVVWAGDDPGLVGAGTLPDLLPALPIPVRGAPGYVRVAIEERGVARVEKHDDRAWTPVEHLRLPAGVQRRFFPLETDDLLSAVARRLFEPRAVPPAARLFVEAVALPFSRGRRGTAPDDRAPWRPSPVWLPVYWHRHLSGAGRGHEARELLSLLDEIAAPLSPAEPERGWDPAWEPLEGAVRLAERHVRRQARVQAESCRHYELPPGWWCLLFHPAPGSDVPGSRIDPASLPPALRRVFELLAPTKPAEIPHRY